MIGQVIDARYKILRSCGSGGMGAVFEAEHLGTGRRFAVKVILPDKAIRPEAFERFQREARAMGKIDSTHIAHVVDAGRDRTTGAAFIAMEMLAGEDLSRLLGRTGPLAPPVVLRIAAGALAGLSAAHEASVVHRDIKPANLFIARAKGGGRVVKLLDFGIAKVLADDAGFAERALTKTGGILGSPSYMSPEQAGGLATIEHRTDIWSLGAVMYEALSGQPPYADAENLGQLIAKICCGPPPPLRDRTPSVPIEISALVERAMRHDPSERWQSAQAMLDEVERLLGGPTTLTDEMVGGLPSASELPMSEDAEASQKPVAQATNARVRTLEGLARTLDKHRSRKVVVLAGVLALAAGAIWTAAVMLPPRSTSSSIAGQGTASSAPSDLKPALPEPLRIEAPPPAPSASVSPVAGTAAPKAPRAPARPKGKSGDPFGGVAQ